MAQAQIIAQAAQDVRSDSIAAANFFGSQISEPGSRIDIIPDERLNRALTLANLGLSGQFGTLGLTGIDQLRSLSPLNQIIARIQRNPSLDRRQKRRTLRALEELRAGAPLQDREGNILVNGEVVGSAGTQKTDFIKKKDQGGYTIRELSQFRKRFKYLDQITRQEGFTIAELLDTQRQFDERIQPYLEAVQNQGPETFLNNLAVAQRASEVARDIGNFDPSNINNPNSLAAQLYRQQQQQIERQRTQAALFGELSGYNPAARLGLIDQQEEDALLNSVLASQQIQTGQLGALQGYLTGQTNQAIGTAGQGNVAGTSAATLAAQQAAATNLWRQQTGLGQAWQNSALLASGGGPSASTIQGFIPQQQQGQGPAVGSASDAASRGTTLF